MADFRSGVQSEQDEPRTPCHLRRQENHQQLTGSCQKEDSEAKLNKLPLAKDEIIGVAIKIIPATDWNT